MASRRKQVLDALTQMVDAALPDASVAFDPSKPLALGAGGAVHVRPGSAEVVGEGSSPHYRIFRHGIVLELAARARPGKDRHEAVDDMLTAIGAAIRANRTLGGLVDWLEDEFPDLEAVEIEGAESVQWSTAVISAEYTVQSPLS